MPTTRGAPFGVCGGGVSRALKARLAVRLNQVRDRWRSRPVRWGSLRRLEPVSDTFGLDRGVPIDRYYIDRFLERHRQDVRGRVLEIGDSVYASRFGDGRPTGIDVLHAVSGNPKATLVADLATGKGVPTDRFDCFILTQTLPFVYDLHAAVRHAHRALAPGGVVLATFPGISQVSRYDAERWGDFWRLTEQSARRLFEETFDPADVEVEAFGNVLAAVAFLHGLADHELRPHELAHRDPAYPVLIGVRARRSAG